MPAAAPAQMCVPSLSKRLLHGQVAPHTCATRRFVHWLLYVVVGVDDEDALLLLAEDVLLPQLVVAALWHLHLDKGSFPRDHHVDDLLQQLDLGDNRLLPIDRAPAAKIPAQSSPGYWC
jgi:hypothetical protein